MAGSWSPARAGRCQVRRSGPFDRRLSVGSETPDDRHPPQHLLGDVGLPMFGNHDAAAAFAEVQEWRKAFPNHYVQVNAYNATYTKQAGAGAFGEIQPPPSPPSPPSLSARSGSCCTAQPFPSGSWKNTNDPHGKSCTSLTSMPALSN